MIKMIGTSTDGRQVLMLGLSEENVKRMREGKPIHIFGAEVNLPVDVVIFWGETERKLAQMVKPFIGPDTLITDTFSDRPKKQ